MNAGKSSISNASSYEEMGNFWDTHDASDYWDEVPSTEFDTDVKSRAIYYPLEMSLAMEMRAIAKSRGLPPKALLAQWVREKLSEVAQERVDEAASQRPL